MLDEFLWGKGDAQFRPRRPSRWSTSSGARPIRAGAANVARNLASLGARAGLAGVIGQDVPGEHLVQLLTEEGIATGASARRRSGPTTHKTRGVRDHAATARPPRHRGPAADRPGRRGIEGNRSTPKASAGFSTGCGRKFRPMTPVIIEDYAKGLIDQELGHAGHGRGEDARKKSSRSIPIRIIRSIGRAARCSSRTGAKFFSRRGLPYSQDEAEVLKAAAIFAKDARHPVPAHHPERGPGCCWWSRAKSPTTRRRARRMSSTFPARATTAIAAFTLALAAGASGIEAAEIAQPRGGRGRRQAGHGHAGRRGVARDVCEDGGGWHDNM